MCRQSRTIHEPGRVFNSIFGHGLEMQKKMQSLKKRNVSPLDNHRI
jgi:hypothetical protein